jgi:hypothetical protein
MIDYKVLAALKLALTALRPKFGDVGSRDVEVAAQQDAIDRALALIEDEFGTVRKTEHPDGFYDICTIVNSDFAIQSLLYDVNLLPEQTMHDPMQWRMTTLIACHWAAAFGKPKAGSGFLTDEWIDDVLKRGNSDPREEDRATARLLAVALYNQMRNTTGLATSDPEGHRQAVADHEAEQASKATAEAFEQWWQTQGQFCNAGGGNYEKTFAFRAWEAASAAKKGA